MRRFFIIQFCWLALVASVATAGTFQFTDGTRVTGKAISISDDGVVFETEDGSDLPRVTWDKFTPAALKALYAEAKTDRDRSMLETMVENLPQEVAKRKEIVIKPIETPPRPKGVGIFGLFGSGVGLLMMLMLYGANLFAAYEVSIYRNQPFAMVCGLAAVPFLGVLSPIIFGAMPTRMLPPEPTAPAAAAEETAGASPEMAPGQSAPVSAMPGGADAPATPAAPAQPKYPDPIVFPRTEFSFNRRFFETKFAGFFRVIPSEAEKDLVLVINCARGRFVGRRISKITPNELYLQVFNNNASADEMIPFMEVSEVQIRHKDTV